MSVRLCCLHRVAWLGVAWLVYLVVVARMQRLVFSLASISLLTLSAACTDCQTYVRLQTSDQATCRVGRAWYEKTGAERAEGRVFPSGFG